MQRVFVRPRDINKNITEFNEYNYIVTDLHKNEPSPLVVFFVGTGGRPENLVKLFDSIAENGYPVVGLEYNDRPSVSKRCEGDPDSRCSEAFREMRIFGRTDSDYTQDSSADSILRRLTDTLVYLKATDGAEIWRPYINVSGPDWSRIIVAGFSQGAGMAALIGKRYAVNRVVLFSGPWDTTESGEPAPWLSKGGITPLDRWYAVYHRRERTAALIISNYSALGIPVDHVRRFDDDLGPDALASSPNPFHQEVVRDLRYLDQWRRLFGLAQ